MEASNPTRVKVLVTVLAILVVACIIQFAVT
jgi:hypothetical protein